MGQYWQSTVGRQLQTPRLIVVPVPMFAEKEQQRGFNQAERLATAFCEATRLPIARDGLIRVRNTRPQFELSPLEREQNLSAAFDVGPALKRRSPQLSVVLLDDIYTTGATARTAIATLAAHHITVAMVVVLAHTKRVTPASAEANRAVSRYPRQSAHVYNVRVAQ